MLYLSILYSLLSPKAAGLKMNYLFPWDTRDTCPYQGLGVFLVKATDLEFIDSMTSLKWARHWRARSQRVKDDVPCNFPSSNVTSQYTWRSVQGASQQILVIREQTIKKEQCVFLQFYQQLKEVIQEQKGSMHSGPYFNPFSDQQSQGWGTERAQKVLRYYCSSALTSSFTQTCCITSGLICIVVNFINYHWTIADLFWRRLLVMIADWSQLSRLTKGQ